MGGKWERRKVTLRAELIIRYVVDNVGGLPCLRVECRETGKVAGWVRCRKDSRRCGKAKVWGVLTPDGRADDLQGFIYDFDSRDAAAWGLIHSQGI